MRAVVGEKIAEDAGVGGEVCADCLAQFRDQAARLVYVIIQNLELAGEKTRPLPARGAEPEQNQNGRERGDATKEARRADTLQRNNQAIQRHPGANRERDRQIKGAVWMDVGNVLE